MWTGLFTLQYKSFLTNLKSEIPAADLARIDPNALKWTCNGFNPANGPYVIPLENQFYIGFYNKADFTKAGVSVGADRLEPALRGVRQAEEGRVHAAGLRQRRPADQRHVLPLVRHELHDDRRLLGGPVAGPVQRADPVDLGGDQVPADATGPSCTARAAPTPTC